MEYLDNFTRSIYNSFTRNTEYLRYNMFILFMIMGLVLLIAGCVGLFYTNVNLAAGSHLWTLGNITFSTFTALGIGILVFMGLFNREFD